MDLVRGLMLPAAISVSIILLIFFSPATAEGSAIVDSKPRLPLIIDGIEASELPVKVSEGSEVCVKWTVKYIDIDRRYVFEKWSNGERSTCIKPKANETVTAYYRDEVLVQIYSGDVDEYSRSFWIESGSIVELEVEPLKYVGQDVRYVFKEWSSGETPFSPRNRIVAVKPLRIEVKWVKEYLLTLTSNLNVKLNGSGWYREGSTAIISAPERIELGDRLLVFDKWVSVGSYPVLISNPSSSTTMISVNSPYIIMPVYRELFLVEVRGVEGGLIDRRWVEKGELYKIDLKNVVEVVPGEVRYVFRGWRDPSIPQTPSLQIEVQEPLRLEALYEKQYYVKVNSEYGSFGGGWYTENSTALVRAPETPQTILFMKRVLNGWSGDIANLRINGGTVLIDKVRRPITLTAVYSIEVDYPALGIFLALVSILAYIGLRPRKKKETEQVKEYLEERPQEHYETL